jgi:hypothetical protein
LAENLSSPAMRLKCAIRGEGFNWYTASRDPSKRHFDPILLISFANDLTGFALALLLYRHCGPFFSEQISTSLPLLGCFDPKKKQKKVKKRSKKV